MTAKHEKGECYNRTEPFLCEHLNVCPINGIYVLKMDEDSPLEEAEEGNPCISMHAITGLTNFEMMKLVVHVDTTTTIRALVDSGSTHSISACATSRLHLEDRVTMAGVCCVIHIFIDSKEFIIDLFVIPLKGYDMVLGIQWLRTPGMILWDFEHTRMCCLRNDHCIMWQGTTRRRTTTSHSMEVTDSHRRWFPSSSGPMKWFNVLERWCPHLHRL
jgi:hypothetical protein